MVPFFVAMFVNPPHDTGLIMYIKWSTFFDVVIITTMTFVHWRKGPEWWTKISPYIFGIFVIFDWLVTPAIQVICCSIALISIWGTESLLYSYLIYFLCMYGFRPYNFFRIVLPILKEAKTAFEVKNEINDLTHDELRVQIVELFTTKN